MKEKKRFWIIFILVGLFYSAYLLYPMGFLEPIEAPPQQINSQPTISSDTALIQEFINANVAVSETSFKIDGKQGEFNLLREELKDAGFDGLNYSKDDQDLMDALEIVRLQKKILEELQSLTDIERVEIQKLQFASQKLSGYEGEVAGHIVLNLVEQNGFKEDYYIEVSKMADAMEENINKVRDGKADDMEEIDQQAIRDNQIRQNRHMVAAINAAEEFNSFIEKAAGRER